MQVLFVALPVTVVTTQALGLISSLQHDIHYCCNFLFHINTNNYQKALFRLALHILNCLRYLTISKTSWCDCCVGVYVVLCICRINLAGNTYARSFSLLLASPDPLLPLLSSEIHLRQQQLQQPLVNVSKSLHPKVASEGKFRRGVDCVLGGS